MIRRLREGETDEELLPLPEGLRLEEVGERVVARRAGDPRAVGDGAERAAPGGDPGGQAGGCRTCSATCSLRATIWAVTTGPTADQLVAKMIATFAERVPPELVAEAETQGLSLHQLLTLAAVVEKEAIAGGGAAPDRRRLPQPPRAGHGAASRPHGAIRGRLGARRRGGLVAGAVVGRQGDSTRRTTLTSTPSLPPGPIANPGIEAIRAVAQPAETASLFFVATCDGTDRHAFAETLEQHNANVARCHDP